MGNDYSDLPLYFKYLIQAWRNAIGDLSPPSYGGWEETRDAAKDNGHMLQYRIIQIIIFLIWSHWLATQFVVLLILFNFLVALVDQSFSEVVDQDKISYFERRAYLNSEYYNFQKLMGSVFPTY